MNARNDNLVEFNPHREAEMQLKVACRLLAQFYARLPLYPTLIMLRDISREFGLPEDLANDLLNKKIIGEISSLPNEAPEWSIPQIDKMLSLIMTCTREAAMKKK